MARGRPFARSLPKLVRGGVAARPLWLATLEKVPPHFTPVVQRRPPRLTYPEDRLRAVYLTAYPHHKRAPVNLVSRSKSEAHPADRFVAIQMRAMREHGLSESDAFKVAERAVAESEMRSAKRASSLADALLERGDDLSSSERLFLASLQDADTDRKLMESLNPEDGK